MLFKINFAKKKKYLYLDMWIYNMWQKVWAVNIFPSFYPLYILTVENITASKIIY